MSFRTIFATAFLVFAAVGYGIVWLYGELVLAHPVAFPHAFGLAFLFVSVLLAAIGAVFYFSTLIIVKAIKRLNDAMNLFAEEGVQTPVPLPYLTPREIRTLTATFANLATRVEAAHEHDVEVARMKSDFISTAAHQLRTPLTGIRWSLEALEKEPLTAEQQSLVKGATEKSHELVRLVRTLLTISSDDAGKQHYAFAEVDLKALAEGVVADFQPLATKRQLSLRFTDDVTVPHVRADQERIKWVLENLVENALRYTPAGGEVVVHIESDDDALRVQVHDTGIGIPNEDRDNIFQRFYRAENAVAKESSGNGLGLSIAKTVATDHGGDLTFSANEDGPGTTFTLTLPLSATT